MLLVVSVALQGAAGVVAAPDSVAPAAVNSVVASPLVHDPGGAARLEDGSRARTLQAKLDASLLPALGGRALLNQLSLLDRGELRAFADSNPASVRQLILDPPAAARTEQWWQLLPLEVQRGLQLSAPEIVGNLAGIPYATRDSANRQYLRQTVAALEERVEHGAGRGESADIRAQLSMLQEVALAIEHQDGEPARSLISLDTAWPGRAAVAIGDLRTADNVSYLIPGMFFTIEGQVVDWAQTAVDLYEEQQHWLDVLGESDEELTGTTIATVAWMGYQTPNLFTVGSEELAADGALYLSSEMDALYNERGENRPFVSLLAHSYGSTAAMKALLTGSFEVDSFAVVGSPGSAAKSVDDLHVRARNMYVGEASWDPVVGSGFFGNDPGAPAYGAHRMSVAGGSDLITDARLSASVGHNEYFAPGSESLRNMALIGIDRGSLVSDGTGADVQRTLAYFDRLI